MSEATLLVAFKEELSLLQYITDRQANQGRILTEVHRAILSLQEAAFNEAIAFLPVREGRIPAAQDRIAVDRQDHTPQDLLQVLPVVPVLPPAEAVADHLQEEDSLKQ